jgi:hypothetical protein
VALGDLGDLGRQLGDPAQLTGTRPDPHVGRHRVAERRRLQLDAVARDHARSLEPLHSLGHRRRGEADPAAQLGPRDPGTGAQLGENLQVDSISQE